MKFQHARKAPAMAAWLPEQGARTWRKGDVVLCRGGDT
jgi:hypothetical protein